MNNPWLAIPLEDYEGHMGTPGVEQLTVLRELFGEVLEACRPASVAVLGVAGGNGLDRIDPAVTKRVVGVDIHPGYLASAQERYGHLPLTLIRADLSQQPVPAEPLALVHAALVFEHAGTEPALLHAATLVAEGGWFSIVLQLPSESTADVAPTPFLSMRTLSNLFRFVDPATLAATLAGWGFVQTDTQRRELPGGKAFWMGRFRRGAARREC
ncbi:MAG TPA: class I SAM-dependent methyltransferase [Bryobacteraceae bacterium]|nr:class I SAM-dependent methyltransferase [Bryobacteraceae bacterium]